MKPSKTKHFTFAEVTYNQTITGCPKSHMHDRLTLVALEKGEVRLYLAEEELILKENEIAIIYPYEIHSALVSQKENDGLYALYVDKSWIEKLQTELYGSKEYILFEKHIVSDKESYYALLDMMNILFEEDSFVSKEELLTEFMIGLIMKTSLSVSDKEYKALFNEIKHYIDENIASILSLEEIAKEFLITRFHLIRLFKDELGMTPYQYILNTQLNRAKVLLAQHIPIAEVAQLCGFHDQSHLYKYFKQMFSITPKAYQKSLL
jgi:AraC-like DNA-binding protein